MRSACCVALFAGIFLLAASVDGQQPAKDKAKPDPKAKTDPKAKAEPAFNMKLTTKDIVLGTNIVGTKIEPGDFKGRVVLVDGWGIHCPPCLAAMPHTAELNTELSDFGLLIVGAHQQDGQADQIRAVALNHKANFAISHQTFVRGADDNKFLPHCIVFDHTGNCIFRGHPNEMEPVIRKAVGTGLVSAVGKEKLAPSLDGIVKDLKAGKPPATILPRVAALRNSAGDSGSDATTLLNAMTAGGRKKLEQAAEKKDTDPVAAFVLIEKLPTAYKGAPIAQEATELINKLKADKSVKSELAARQYMENVKKLDQQLGLGAEDPRKPEFQKSHAPVLKQLKEKVSQMKKSWPDAPTTKEALELADRYGVEIK